MIRTKKYLTVVALALGVITVQTASGRDAENPFFKRYATPFEVPPFDLIKVEHFKPAILKGIKDQQAEIDAIASNGSAPDFFNTVEAMEKSGQLLGRVTTVFYNLNSANTNDAIQKLARELSPLLSAHGDNIILNEKLFARVKHVWTNKDRAKLNPEQQRLLYKTYKSFVRSGANLSETDKEKLRALNSQLSMLSLQFGQNLLAETNNYKLVVDFKKDLAGLPEELILAAEQDANERGFNGKWLFTLQNPSVMPFLQYADNRVLREKIWSAYMMRGNNNNEHDNKNVIKKIINLRTDKAKLLGYNDYAAYALEETMAKNAESAYTLLNRLWTPALEVAKREAADMQSLVNKSGQSFELAPYDWRYYTEKVRKEKFNLDEQELKPYFSLDNVRNGAFTVAQKLYGLTFTEVKDIPVYHKEVKAYEVKEANGKHVGLLYTDFFPRASKRGGAWMTSYRSQRMDNGKRMAPVISIVCNFSKPVGDAPALLTFDEVTTLFHEFGHALHGLLSNVRYESLAGTAVSRDFVELPSQIMENWAAEPDVLKMFAKHYKTGEVISDELIAKIEKSGTFNQGFATVEYLAASLLDMDYHTLTSPLDDVNKFEKAAMNRLGLTSNIIPRYKSTYFNHIFAGGYSAGYYSYIWSGVLDTDAFDVFKRSGNLFNQDKAKLFRSSVLERGGTDDPMNLYKRFKGSEPDIAPLLKKRGLN